jgi:hypothetical protein
MWPAAPQQQQQQKPDISGGGYVPKPGMPSKAGLEYLKLVIELLLLLLAVPWILRELARHPGEVSRKAANRHLKAD